MCLYVNGLVLISVQVLAIVLLLFFVRNSIPTNPLFPEFAVSVRLVPDHRARQIPKLTN